MQEAKTKVVAVDVVDTCTLQRTLTYLYTDIYDDERLPSIDYAASETNDLLDKSDGEASWIELRKLNESALRFRAFETELEEVEACVSSPQFDEQSMQPKTQDPLQREQLNAAIRAARRCLRARLLAQKEQPSTFVLDEFVTLPGFPCSYGIIPSLTLGPSIHECSPAYFLSASLSKGNRSW